MTPDVRHYVVLYRRENPARPINECYWAARRHVHFHATLKASVAAHAKRSKAAKKAWKTRKAGAR